MLYNAITVRAYLGGNDDSLNFFETYQIPQFTKYQLT